MKLKFISIHFVNFLSFSEAFFDLDKSGFTLVSGINKNPSDQAISNGSGKSTFEDAICWVLTGTTIRGSKDIVNIQASDGAFVELVLLVDNKKYRILRSKDHSIYKTNLKIWQDDIDLSGKGIRDSQNILTELLPDLNPQLLGSIIILSQGLPFKFSDSTPSGRKEILEKLSKSDFMIQDLKDKVTQRKSELCMEIRNCQDESLKSNTELQLIQRILDEANIKFLDLNSIDITTLKDSISSDKVSLNNLILNKNSQENILKELSLQLQKNESDKQNFETQYNQQLITLKDEQNIKLQEYQSQLTESTLKQNQLQQKIKDIESIVDICPTCHQKIAGIYKPDSSSYIKQYNEEKENFSIIKNKYDLIVKQNEEELLAFNQSFLSDSSNYKNLSDELNLKINNINSHINDMNYQISSIQSDIRVKELKLDSYLNDLNSLKKIIDEKTEESKKLTENILYYNNKETLLNNHLNLINKMIVSLNRDFRGFLLKNIIEFIDKKSKEYCKEVFGNTNISFTLEGNNISISLLNKEYESLSGGERQKVDLIIQLALREMLCTYLNFSSNIIVFDELFDNLDSLGCQNILNLISKKLEDVENIFIITHHSDIQIPSDYNIIIEKGLDQISRIT